MGCSINLDKVPTKYKMENHNILISESQERMLLVCKEENLEKIGEIFKKWDLEYSVIGQTNMTGKYSVYYNNCLLYEKNMDSFNDIHDYSNTPINKITTKTDNSEKVKAMEKWQIYDSTVGNRTLKGPDKPGSFSVLNIPEVGKQLILTWGESFKECHEIMKNFENVKPLCIVNCLNYGDPKFSLYDFKEDVHDLNKNCLNHNIPIVGGNVSLYNTTGNKSIIPTPILVMMGITL
jgi:phosphoribosylformylglycinamidine synthase